MTQSAESELAQLRAEIHKAMLERLAWFQARYDIVNFFTFGPDSERVFLGDQARHACRYCGRMEPDVEFKKIAHAIPDQVGNDWLFDNAECDTCNGNFANRVEDDFGKWSLPWRTLGRIKGKGGVPSIKSNDKKFRIDASLASSEAETGAGAARHGLKIRIGANDVRHELDEATRAARLTLDRPAYVPMGVFKCFVKMAIAVMPPEEEQLCAHLKRWILLPTHTFESYPYRPLRVLHQFAPGPLPNDRLACWLLRRRAASPDDCHFMQFVLQISNHVFQIALPMHIEDRRQLQAGKVTTALWPNTWADVEHQLRYGRTVHKEYDLSGVDLVRGETMSMVFSYDQLIDQLNTVAEPEDEPKAGEPSWRRDQER